MGKMLLSLESEFVQKVREACQRACDVMALRDGKALFQAVVGQQKCQEAFDVGLQTPLVAYQKDLFKILSIMPIDSQSTRLNT